MKMTKKKSISIIYEQSKAVTRINPCPESLEIFNHALCLNNSLTRFIGTYEVPWLLL